MQRREKNLELYNGFVHDHAAGLYRFAFRLSGEADTAEDLVQEVFLEAWRSLHSLRDPGSAKAWLYQILRHRYAHWLRDRARRPDLRASADRLENVPSLPGTDPLDVLCRQEILQKALDALDDRYKESFLMVFMQGFTCKETAGELDVPLGTVLSRIHRARKFLRQFLRDHSFAWEEGELSDTRGEGLDDGLRGRTEPGEE